MYYDHECKTEKFHIKGVDNIQNYLFRLLLFTVIHTNILNYYLLKYFDKLMTD